MLQRLTALFALLLAAAGAAAHDFWIEPSSFAPQPGQLVRLRFLVGEHLAGDPVGRPGVGEFRSFSVDLAGQRRPVPGRSGADQAGQWRVPATGAGGSAIVIFHSLPIPIEVDAPTFNKYLKEEGLDHAIEQRAARGDSAKPGREFYTRNAKALLRLGEAAEPGDRVVGLPLELVAERNPALMRAGDELPLLLLHQGKPLPGALVVAIGRADPSRPVSARSDAQGRVRLRLDAAGFWLAKAVHIVPHDKPAEADWASQWASLTFELPAR